LPAAEQMTTTTPAPSSVLIDNSLASSIWSPLSIW
jgi:hypothetical protein